ncbi:LOW QUALITY PROTEIN: NLR family CARD domain-containing protein 3 [Astyanax mexicanus]|uniref:LOW QUALITY PROTEIN: NLR family CARD domain-containing protein 3 n=1 Tax=Astyanax mexicanus TaxID=7994 RepID=UPI0020CAD9FA|nr:LOW QUALITY PROTEIN: NLR family CARD domain-containing protein 3 [Astyanax mexicanus]
MDQPGNFISGGGISKLRTESQRAVSPAPSSVSMESDWSMEQPGNFITGGGSSEPRSETQRTVSPEPSCVSLKSDWSMDNPTDFCNEAVTSDLKTETQRAVSPAHSSVSMESDWSMEQPGNFISGEGSSEPRSETQRTVSPEPSCVSMKSDWSMDNPTDFCNEAVTSDPNIKKKKSYSIPMAKLDHIFKKLRQKFISLVENELNTFKKLLSPDYPACPEKEVDDDQREGLLEITLHILRNMKETDLANTLQSKLAPASHRKLKSNLRDKCQRINEGISDHGNSAFLNEIYTELYITEGGTGEVNQEHEVNHIEAASRKTATQEISIKCHDIFKPLTVQNQPIRTVLTKGVAGIGKTVSVQKFILDWAEGKENQDVLFIFPLPFRELNLIKKKKLSLVNLLQHFFPETQDLKPRHYKCFKIMFVFDGLDECRLPLDFKNNEKLVDIEKQTSVDVLLTNLIKGNMLPSALLWITSRPAAVGQIPPECVDQVTEVRGFGDSQKQEYFKKRISDRNLANKVFTHIKSLRSLYIMCHIPVFCWIAATVLEKMLSDTERKETPKTLTQMFTHFLIVQIKHMSQKYSGKLNLILVKLKKSILALGKLAFQQLEKGNLIFYEEDLRKSGIDVREVSVYSGVCTQIFREEHELHLGKVFSFVHLSVQEFLAALYAFLNKKDMNPKNTDQQTTKLSKLFSRLAMTDFLKSAVDKALQSESGHLDLFLRFLLGLSLESNQTLLRGILTHTERSPHSNEEIINYIKQKIEENPTPEKSINLFHCLNELNDHSLVQDVQKYIRRGAHHHLHQASLSPAQWSALVFVLLNSEKELDEFDLSKYDPSEECLLRLLPVVKSSRRAILASCNIGEKTCENLGLVLNLENSSLKELDLSNNDLQDSGVELLSAGLKSSHCKLQILRLSGCMITEKGFSSLASALSSNPYHLKELDLTFNHPEESGVKLLSARLEDPHCKLETLRVEHGGKIRMKPGLKKWACDLTLDPNTAHTNLCLTEGNRKVEWVREEQPYPDLPERFNHWEQVMSREILSGRCYWEAKWNGEEVDVALTYKTISRKGDRSDSMFGQNVNSWNLSCSDKGYTVYHNKNGTDLPPPSSGSGRVGVYVDCAAGTLSFYSVASDTHTLTHLHTFNTTFTQPLYAGFWCDQGSSVSVCKIE